MKTRVTRNSQKKSRKKTEFKLRIFKMKKKCNYHVETAQTNCMN